VNIAEGDWTGAVRSLLSLVAGAAMGSGSAILVADHPEAAHLGKGPGFHTLRRLFSGNRCCFSDNRQTNRRRTMHSPGMSRRSGPRRVASVSTRRLHKTFPGISRDRNTNKQRGRATAGE
jgi:hypothetical protein